MAHLYPSPQQTMNHQIQPSANTTVPVDVSRPLILGRSHSSYYIAVGIALLVAYLLQPKKQGCTSVPFYKASRLKWMFDAEGLVRDSYGKFRDQVYNIKASEGLRTLIPARLIGELKGLPEEHLSAQAAVSEAMLCEYTKFGVGDHTNNAFVHLVRTKLNHHLARLVPRLKSELEFIIAEEFPECEDWTPMKVQPFLLRVVARLSGSTFVGSELSRTEEWMQTSITNAIHVFIAVLKLQFFPTWIRPVGQYFVSELRQSRRDVDKAAAMLKPITEERLRNAELDPGYQQPDDFIQWLLEATPDGQKTNYHMQAQTQLVLSASSIHTTSNLATDCIYDLAAHPEYQDILREEAYEVLVQDGGWARKDSMAKLQKMDSFIKETQRMAGNVTSFIRKVIKPIDLSDGTRLSAGTNLLAPLCGINMDERYFPDPTTFDGLRFWKLRKMSAEAANRWQFTTITDTSLAFGAGKHACPGRFFAASELKLILAYYVLNYDIKLKEGESRPEPMMFMMTKGPNQKAEVLFRRRS